MEDARTPAQRVGRAIVALLALFAVVSSAGGSTATADKPYPLTFPVDGTTSYSDTWGAPRSEGRTHKGADIFADKGTPVVAAADGTVTRMKVGERAGRYIVVEHLDGWRSLYLHLDNDTPGTDDGLGGAPAPGITVGTRVSAGDVLDYVGDSGNAEETPSHLHFELHRPDATAINPTPHLDAARSDATAINPTPHLDAARSDEEIRAFPAGIEGAPSVQPPDYTARSTELVAHFDPGGGFNAGLAAHGDTVYMGTWGRPDACPGSGVRLMDVSDPAQPALLATVASAAEFPGTSTDSVWVEHIETDSFTGDVAAVAVRLCDTRESNRMRSAFRGLAIYDVTDPADPRLLSTFDTGPRTQGVNELSGAVRADGRFVIGATVMQSYLHTEGELGDFRLIDATDPSQPYALSDWDQRRTSMIEQFDADERTPTEYHIHSVTFASDGMSAWLAAWDGGAVMLDIEVLTDPVATAYVPIDPITGGNVHSLAFDEASGLLIRSDEELNPIGVGGRPGAWGSQTIYDVADLRNVELIGDYQAPTAVSEAGTPRYSGFFSVHEADIVDGIEYVSAYSDGLRIVDLTDPTEPAEIGSFVPPPAPDRHGHWTALDGSRSFPLVWGVEVQDELIFLSDVNSGLWIVRRTQPGSDTEGATERHDLQQSKHL